MTSQQTAERINETMQDIKDAMLDGVAYVDFDEIIALAKQGDEQQAELWRLETGK